MTKRELTSAVTFGKRTAEEEGPELAAYFVETDQWRRIFEGQVDIVFGAKGSGKSAIYSLLNSRAGELSRRGITVIPAEDPRGAPVFKDLVADPPASEAEFRGLWKLYFLCLVGARLRKAALPSEPAHQVVGALEQAELLPEVASLRRTLRAVQDYVRAMLRWESVEGGVKLDPTTGAPAFTGKITLREPASAQRKEGFVSVDDLLQLANSALDAAGQSIWLALDRLDVAFADTEELEANALKALFHVYIDLTAFPTISPKVFLRSDIWNRITKGGFREASHITNTVEITWTPPTLLNLVVRRLLHNEAARDFYHVTEADVLASAEEQRNLFYRVFPGQVDSGPNKPETFFWLLSRTTDGTRQTAPRELIHLLNSIRDEQSKMLEIGNVEPPGEQLFDRAAIKAGLPLVSKARFDQTLCAEYPRLREPLLKLEGQKTQQSAETLSVIWGISVQDALKGADELVEVGFFEKRGTTDQPQYWVPFLYRDALKMVQGTAE